MKRYAISLQVFALAALLLGVYPTARAQESQQSLSEVTPLSIAPALKTFSSSVEGGTHVTISIHGNITRFLSPGSLPNTGYEHIGVGAFSEGYILCYRNPFSSATVNAYDVGDSEVGFGPSIASCSSPTACAVTRNTTDGVLQLRQNFSFNGAERRLRIQMTVKNLTGATVSNIILRRQVDFDIDTGGSQGWASFINHHASTAGFGVFAWTDSPPSGKVNHGMILRHIVRTSGVGTSARVTSNILDTSCDPPNIAATNPVLDQDVGDTLSYSLDRKSVV